MGAFQAGEQSEQSLDTEQEGRGVCLGGVEG